MASVESVKGRIAANDQGWRTFRALLPEKNPPTGEIMCTNTQDLSAQCQTCSLCSGSSSKSRLDITDRVHELFWKIHSVRKQKLANGELP